MTTAAETRAWTPGLHDGVPFEDYLEIDALSFSDMESWLRGKPKNLGRRGLVGSIVHCLVLEGKEATAARYVQLDAKYDLRTAEGRKAVTELADESGKVPVKPAEWADVVAMYKSIKASERAQKALALDSRREVTAIAQLKGCDVLTKARIDLLEERFLLDLKTTHHASHDFFVDSIVDFNYAARAAFYIDNVAAITGKYLPFRWLCVSTKPPHEVWVEQCSPEQLAFGRKYYQAILRLYERYGRGVEDE